MGMIGRYLDHHDAEERDRVITAAVERFGPGSYSSCLVGIAAGYSGRATVTPTSRILAHHLRHYGLMERRRVEVKPEVIITSIWTLENQFDRAFRRAKTRGRHEELIAAIKARAAKPHRIKIASTAVQEEVAV